VPPTAKVSSSGWGVKIGDSVTVPEPFLRVTDFQFSDQHFQFSSLRVDNPVMLVVNGRKLTNESQAPCELSIQTRSE